MACPILTDGDTFEHRGYSFRVRFQHDDDMREPWKEHDGHGIVSEWTSRDKAPYERILVSDRSSCRYYDVQASTKLARKDGWGCSHSTHDGKTFTSGHNTKRAAIACAVNEDFENLRAWCNDEWEWTIVSVTLLDENGRATSERECIGGIDSYRDGCYCTDTAYELANVILSRVEVEHPDVILSIN